MDEIDFKFKHNLKDIDLHGPSGSINVADTLEGKLLINPSETPELQVKIFFDSKSYFGRKLSVLFKDFKENYLTYFSDFTFDDDEFEAIDFSESRITQIRTGIGTSEMTISIDSVRVIKKNVLKRKYSEIFLSLNSFDIIDKNIQYNAEYSDLFKFKLEPKNAIKSFVSAGRVKFRPEVHLFHSDLTKLKIDISKEPCFVINHNKVTSLDEIKKHVNFVCSIYSLYLNYKIDYYFARYILKNKVVIEIKKAETLGEVIKTPREYFTFRANPINVFYNLNNRKAIENMDFLNRIIPKYILSMTLNNESRFMILFTILDEIKEQLIKSKKTRKQHSKHTNTFDFKININPKVTALIKELSSYLNHPEQSEEFLQNTSAVIKNLKLKRLKNQYAIVEKALHLKFDELEVSVDRIVTIRNDIFHGKEIDDKTQKQLTKINQNFSRLINISIYRLLGINVLDSMTTKIVV